MIYNLMASDVYSLTMFAYCITLQNVNSFEFFSPVSYKFDKALVSKNNLK